MRITLIVNRLIDFGVLVHRHAVGLVVFFSVLWISCCLKSCLMHSYFSLFLSTDGTTCTSLF
jgi:hypothetical protein